MLVSYASHLYLWSRWIHTARWNIAQFEYVGLYMYISEKKSDKLYNMHDWTINIMTDTNDET